MNPIEYTHLIKKFCEEKIKFVVIGGFAAIAHGVVRVTMDLDLAISLKKEDLSHAWDILNALGFKIRQPILQKDFIDPKKLSTLMKKKGARAISFIHTKQSYLVVDILFNEPLKISADDITWINLFGFRCPILKIDKLIKLKKEAGRPKDTEDIRELKKIKEKK